MKEKRVLIIECTPKSDKMDESLVLREFLRMTIPKKVHVPSRRLSKWQLISYLENKRDLDDFKYVHLSGHGDEEPCTFRTPRGALTAEEFPEGCFLEKTVTLSACALGKKAFVEPFMQHTEARCVIAPQREVLFVDAALWFVNFYYQILHCGVKPKTAYERTEKYVGYLRGGFKFWPR